MVIRHPVLLLLVVLAGLAGCAQQLRYSAAVAHITIGTERKPVAPAAVNPNRVIWLSASGQTAPPIHAAAEGWKFDYPADPDGLREFHAVILDSHLAAFEQSIGGENSWLALKVIGDELPPTGGRRITLFFSSVKCSLYDYKGTELTLRFTRDGRLYDVKEVPSF